MAYLFKISWDFFKIMKYGISISNYETKLYCLSSGAATSSDIEIDVLRAEKSGEEAKKQFIRERLEMKDHFFRSC